KDGVMKENGCCVFNGIGYIKRGGRKCIGKEESGVLMLCENGGGDGKGIVLIEEDDVEGGDGG
ncbi:SufD family Fe-S cluster assembly protein, partial [Staphylococcus epidermidis]